MDKKNEKKKKIPEKVTIPTNELDIADFKSFKADVAPLTILVPAKFQFPVASLSIAVKKDFEFGVGKKDERKD
jgi:hypothetical protein